MTDITIPCSGTKKHGFGKANRHSIKIDMTPMVDLGFLLITFFIFTSAMSDPTAMPLNMPNDNGEPMPTKQSGALVLIPSSGNLVHYYEGDPAPGKLQSGTLLEIRNVIMNKKRRTIEEDLFIIIKPAIQARYGNVVDVLDEMLITDVKKYALVKITDEEQAMIDTKLRPESP